KENSARRAKDRIGHTEIAFHPERRVGDVRAIEIIGDVEKKKKRQKTPRNSRARTFPSVCLQRSHRCAQHNGVRNAHNLENVVAAQLGKALAPRENTRTIIDGDTYCVQMKLTFVGTRGEIEMRIRRRRMHALRAESRRRPSSGHGGCPLTALYQPVSWFETN